MKSIFTAMQSRGKQIGSSRAAGVLAVLSASSALLLGVGIANAAGEPVISSILATPSQNGATITWATDENANSQIAYGTSTPYTASTTLDSNRVMNHSETISGLTPSTIYHFAVMSTDASSSIQTSADQTFTTLASSTASSTLTGTSTGTSTDLTTLQNEITALQKAVASLERQIALILQLLGQGTTATPAMPTVDQNGQSFMAGGTIDFGGRNFAREENVAVSLKGVPIATAHADGGGNFSTGSMTLPTMPGTYTYKFMGASGDSASATVTVH